MIGVSGSGLLNCTDCGRTLHETQLHADYDTCMTCGDERAAEEHAEAVAEFRSLALEWFTQINRLSLTGLVDCDDAARRAERAA